MEEEEEPEEEEEQAQQEQVENIHWWQRYDEGTLIALNYISKDLH